MFQYSRAFIQLDFRILLLVFIAFQSINATTSRAQSSIESHGKLHVSGDQFVDELGRQVILNGINVVSKSKNDNYLFQSGPELYSNLKKWGMNSIRLIVIWDGVEPEPDQFDEVYLNELDQKIQWATDNELFVVLDLHQDLFSSKFSDGAPAWATLDKGLPHLKGDVWSDSYLISPAVHQAFDSFWDNAKASGGKGLQDHIAEVWQLLAKRYRDNPYVIGYDLFNEPFPGSLAQEAMPALLKGYAGLHFEKTGELLSEEQLLQMWSNPESRSKALQTMDSSESFGAVIDGLFPITSRFEREKLQPFYQKMANAIRETGDDKIIFLEHTYFSNMGVKSAIERTILPNGHPDSQVAYAPHAYDLVVDTKFSQESSLARMDFIYHRISEKGKELQMPVWLGEWGAYYSSGEKMVPVARDAASLLEKYQFSNAYWSYASKMENLPYFKMALYRPYPVAIAGNLEYYSFDQAKKVFQISWIQDPEVKAETLIYFPDLGKVKLNKLSISGAELLKNDGADSGYLVIPFQKGVSKMKLEIQL